jgi:23S rRNA (uracil1939-C5)-methyltransferase
LPDHNNIPPLKKGSEIDLQIESLAFGGRGVARLNGFVVFVEDALPGQLVRAQLLRKRGGYGEARILEIVQQSPHYVAPRCHHFDDCGGCIYQNYDYAAQLETKHRQVCETLRHIGGFEDVEVLPPIPSPRVFHYRNKMEFSFSPQRWVTSAEIKNDALSAPKDFAVGLHVRDRYDKILTIDECHLQSEWSNRVLGAIKNFTEKHHLRPYTTRDHSGFWRFIVLREGKHTGDRMVNMVTADHPTGRDEVARLAEVLGRECPETTTIVHNINRKKAQIAFGDEEVILLGPGHIRERVGEFTFRISANSFFQTNTLAAEVLYSKAAEYAALTGNETIYDLYCGAGTISIYVSQRAKQVVGFEIVADAIRDAAINCSLNQVSNCAFIEGDLKDELAKVSAIIMKWGKPDVVIVDPPRSGMHPKVVGKLLDLAPQRIVYVSCNPATFARDARELCRAAYRLEKVQPVDMFPHTGHIELVASMTKGQ